MTTPKNQPSTILKLVRRTERLRKDIELAIKSLPETLALSLVESDSFTGFNPDGFALFDYRLMNKAFEQKVKELFDRFPTLLYLTLGYCTDQSESASATGINRLVFGFFPIEHQQARVDNLRDWLLFEEVENLTARERLVFETIPVEIPAYTDQFPSEFEFFEEQIKDSPGGFPEAALDLKKVAEMWFEAYDRYFRDETDSLVQYWRDGATLARNRWDDHWFQTN